MKTDSAKPTIQPQHDAKNPMGQAHTMPAKGSAPAPAPMTGHINLTIDPKSKMGHNSFE